MRINRLFQLSSLAIILIAGVMSGCGPTVEEQAATLVAQTAEAASSTPTITPTFTPTSTASPTQTATATPRPLSDAALKLEDLPAGFEREPLEDFDVVPGVGRAFAVLVVESGFAFSIDTEVFQVIVGQTELLGLRTEKAQWDQMSEQVAENFVENTAVAFGSVEVLGMEEIPNLDHIGEQSYGLTGVFDVDPPFRMDVIFFRRGELGAATWTFYYDGDVPYVPIAEVAEKLDSLIIEVLEER